MKSTSTLTDLFLAASGLIAIGIVAFTSHRVAGDITLLLTHGAFTAAFLTIALDKDSRLPNWVRRGALIAMFSLTLLSLAQLPGALTLILSVVMAACLPYGVGARASWLLLAGADLVFLWLLQQRHPEGALEAGAMALLALQGFALSSSLARQQAQHAQDVLAVQNAELQKARSALADLSQTQERLRIAGELHDTVGHRLTALQLNLEATIQHVDSPLADDLRHIQTLVRDTLEEVRTIVRNMRSPSAKDLRAAIEELAVLTPGLAIHVQDPLPTPQIALVEQLVQCCREAVANAVRHGGATEIWFAGGASELIVTDNGSGLDRGLEPGVGLDNMNARLSAFHGKAQLANRADRHGCRLTLTFSDTAE